MIAKFAHAVSRLPFGANLLYRVPSLLSRLEQHLAENPVRTITKTADGFSMHVDTADFLQRTIYINRDCDGDISAILRKRLGPGMTFVDIGANIGFFSLLAAKLVGPTGRVIAFEPNPPVFAALMRNAEHNGMGWIETHQVGLFDREGGGTLHVPDKNCGAATMRPSGDDHVTISLVRLDDVVTGSVDLIKIDVEGAEVAALRGARNVLARCPAVVCEVSEYSLKAMGSSHDELYDLMAERGFTAQIIGPIRRSTLFKDRVFFQYDVLFTKD